MNEVNSTSTVGAIGNNCSNIMRSKLATNMSLIGDAQIRELKGVRRRAGLGYGSLAEALFYYGWGEKRSKTKAQISCQL